MIPVVRPQWQPDVRHDAPTDAAPGSEAKIVVLCERADRELPLFSPGDFVVFDRQVSNAPRIRLWNNRPFH